MSIEVVESPTLPWSSLSCFETTKSIHVYKYLINGVNIDNIRLTLTVYHRNRRHEYPVS